MSIYKQYSPEETEELLSNFLISSWSYSKLSQFARNEKAFEMSYIYGLMGKSSATQVAGKAYHKAIEYYFIQKKEGNTIDLAEMEAAAFQYIDDQPSNVWKIQKTTKTVEECIVKATKTVADLLKNFCGEKDVFENDIAEIIGIEEYGDEWLTINGVDIPLPCHFVIDLVVKTKDDKIVIIDHKSKTTFTEESEIALVAGNQAITYVLGYESKTGTTVNEVWFIENKTSQNKDKSAQLHVNKIIIDENTRKLYQLQLYDPLRRMIQAIRDPDYVYLINYSDNFIDRAELYDFWARTMICEVDDFNVEESKKQLITQRLKKIRDASVAAVSPQVIKNFKENAASFIQYDLSNKNMTQSEKIEHVLRTFGIIVKVPYQFDGFQSSTYLIEASAGVKLSSIYSHRLDIANALDVKNVRIGRELMVYEGKSYLPIDFAKKREGILYFNPDELQDMRIPLGKDNFNNTIVWDLGNNATPHALICGGTGSGKSACITSIIEYAQLANVKNIIIFDPKYEFTDYMSDGRFIVVNEILEIENTMYLLVKKMNEMVMGGKKETTLIIFDEFADAVANSRKDKDLKIYGDVLTGYTAIGAAKYKREVVGKHKSLEENMRILLQKGRSSGFRIAAATQRASVNVISGDAKVNFPIQICFRVQKETDSRVVLDEPGAESLNGNGDGLIKSPEYNDIIRFQSFFFDKAKASVLQ